ncbi:helicase C-terminal domain-containing protein [Streptomyces yunnanensis]|uniref:Helicase conserved C-terminal domain-containing protein n=1 Tax=Streptomyces yunnanensis TaxID=156453 RepID=A0A9X8MYH4_9ACTN|nr:helicase C-terminal domain-containing protein [Streptomyces yunnanensis]SHM31059.1 Helicase conserved C-terminal domain-containing protein [Streptomyces yunnanensis]
MTTATPRTLAEELRTRSDRGLAGLLRARPDLLNPVPGDLTQLATRAGTRASVVRAVERLDTFALQTAEALAIAPDPCPYPTLAALMAGDAGNSAVAAALPRAVAALRAQALVWGPDDRLRLVRTARELLTPSPAHPSPTGLGPTVPEATAGMSPGRIQEILAAAGLPATHDPVSAVAALTGLFCDRARMAALLDTAPAEAVAVLDKLLWGPPYGAVTDRPAAHLQWLLDRGLLLPAGARNVVLPREAALHLRAGRAHRTPEPVPPALDPTTARDPQLVDNAAASQAFTALATVEELLKEWDLGGPPVLRAGGLSVRDLKRTAVALDTTEPLAAFWLELAHAAGLIASDGEADERYAATPAAEDWLQLPDHQRWAALVAAWLPATRTPGVVGTADAKGRALAALGPHLDRSPAPEVRHRVLTLLATLPPGTSVPERALLSRLRWERPLRAAAPATQPPAASSPAQGPAQAAPLPTAADGAAGPAPTDDLRSRLAQWTLVEAELLGVTGRGALAAHGRTLLRTTGDPGPSAETDTGPRADTSTDADAIAGALTPLTPAEATATAVRAAALLAPLLPEPLDHILLQADLTAVAPGPLHRPLAEALAVLADIESKGGATVYRFTPASVRRALDAGRSAAELQAFLTTHSRTPVPQPLAYLIDDVARKHGQLRVGAASAYVRCDDDALLSEILADRRAAALRLRRLAPTVLAAQSAPEQLLDGLRAMGYAPAAESAAGDVLVARADSYRTPPRTAPTPVPDGPPPPDRTLLEAAVRAIRAGDLAATAERKPAAAPTDTAPPTPGALPRTTSAETLATMQAAVLTSSPVWIGYVNADGAASQRVIAPVRVEGGYVTAYDHTSDEVRTYPLHRITGVSELADDAV